MEFKVPEDVEKKNVEQGVEQPPDWLPDGWVMVVKRGDDGAHYQYYVSPVSGARFRMKAEVLNYLFSEMEERCIQSKEAAALPKAHEWLPEGWLVEIRAGGENMDKMFKFYVHRSMGVRLFSKEDVLLYVKEMKITEYDTDGQCDTNSQDNILALVEFNPYPLPQGWVKEIVYRKTREGIRKDPYFTDPVSQYVFRTKKAALRFLETGKVTNRQFIQNTSVHDLYSFEKSADLSLRKRLTNKWKDAKASMSSPKQRGSALRTAEDTDSDTATGPVSPNEQQNMKKSMETERGLSSLSKTINRPRGRPRKVVKVNGWNSKKARTKREMKQHTSG